MNSQKPGQWRGRPRFFAYLFASVVLVLTGCWFLYHRESNQVIQRLKDSEVLRVSALSQLLRIEMLPVATDLRSLAEGDGLNAYFETHSAADRDRALHQAVFYSLEQPSYDKIRVIDLHGRELMRVDHGGVVAASTDLQDKSDRPFFLRSRFLAPGQIYVSAFDLTQNNGKILVPWVPTLRLATPVYDADGEHGGFYVINYSGNKLVTSLARGSAFPRRLRLINSFGYWIKAEKPADEWGFMIPDRADKTLAKTDPGFWAEMSLARTGQEDFHGGIITWEKINLGELFAKNGVNAITDEPFLIIALQVVPEEIQDRIGGLQHNFAVAAASLILLTATTAAFFWARQNAIAGLRRNEEDLSVTLHSIGDAVIATDTDGNVTRMNGVAETLTGWPRDEARGRPIAEVFRIVREDTREPAEIPVRRVLDTGMIHGLVNHTILIARDGEERAIADSASPIKGRNGAVLGVVLVFRDVSDEREAEIRLANARAELDRFFEVSLDFLCISSGDGYFKRMSPAVTDILGWTVDEMLARPYVDFIHPDDIAATKRQVERQLERGEPVFAFENRYRTRDGGWRVLSWRSMPQPDGLMYATARDVTEVKAVEQEIKQLNADLQARSTKLEAANLELEAFSYSVSHDLRAPLRHVQGYVEMLNEEVGDALPEKARRYLGVIASASMEMSQLIENLLSFSRMGRAQMQEETVDLDHLLQEVVQGLAASFQGRQIRWSLAALPSVRGDLPMLRQVLVNLLSNAIKYSRNRPLAEITVGWRPVADEQVEVFVRDNGAGFDMRYADKLFGVFQRLHRADEFEGTGIGLAHVRRIILRHGGKIWAEAAPEAGATFYFTLHLPRTSALQEQPAP